MLSASLTKVPGMAVSSLLLILAIVGGALLGHALPDTGQWLGDQVDYTLLVLVGLLFFGVRLEALVQAAGHLRFLAIAVVANFLIVPLIGYGVASVFLSAQPLIMVGLMIYFMSPCTDWFLGFARLSGGNVALGTALIPINMVVQLLLYPLYVGWFTQHSVQVQAGTLGDTLLHWFLIPLVIAVATHQIIRVIVSREKFGQLLRRIDQVTPWLIALLVLEIFAANISAMVENGAIFVRLLTAAFVFFVLTFLLGEGLSRVFQLRHPEYALLSMTIAARNAPLMLAITMVALPDQPLIYAALIIGMLIEFPHLAVLRRLLLRKSVDASASLSTRS